MKIWKNEIERSKKIFNDIKHFLFQNVYSLGIFLILAIVCTILVLRPFFQYGFSFSLKKAGYSYLTTENIWIFLRKPTTLIIIAGMIFILSVIFLLQFSILITFFQLIKEEKKIDFFSCLLIGIKRSFYALKPNRGVLFFLALLMAFVFDLFALTGVITRTHIPGYLADSFLEIKGAKYIVVLFLSLSLYLAARYLLIMCFIFLEAKDFRKSLKETKKLLTGKKLSIILLFLLWNIIIAVVLILLYLVVVSITALFSLAFTKKEMVFAQFLNSYEKVNMIMIIFAAVIGIVLNTGMVCAIYYRLKEEAAERLPKHPYFIDKPYLKKDKSLKRGIFVVSGIIILAMISCFYDIARYGFLTRKGFTSTVITSHRGSSYNAPENTIPALEKAIYEMADYAEIDVRQTKDGVLVLLHDAKLKRTAGVNRYIWDLTYDELQNLDVGAWFGTEFKGTKIPTLEEVFVYCKNKIRLNIEIKESKYNQEIEKKVVELIEQYGYEYQCMITGLTYKTLKTIKEYNPNLKTGYIMSVAWGNFYQVDFIDFYSMRSDFITEKTIKKAHNIGKEIHAWTVNSKVELERMKKIGIDGVITDKPVLAREVLYTQEANRTFLELLKIALN